MIKATIITIGDEILIGQIVDTNSAGIAKRLNEAGITVDERISVGDDAERIAAAVRGALDRTQVVILTGGLGPTKDDITKKTLARRFGSAMRYDEAVALHVERMLTSRGIAFNALNRSQAEVPACCKVLFNRHGTAPGMWFERDGHVLVSMPGVPFETEGMLPEVAAEVCRHFHSDAVLRHHCLMAGGISESALAQRLEPWESALPGHMHLAYLPVPGLIRLRLDGRGSDAGTLDADMQRETSRLKELLGDNLRYDGDATAAEIALAACRRRGFTMGCAESCTGGTIAQRITAVAGCSDVFLCGVVSYSNDAKTALLGVDPSAIATHGAVSREVVKQMAHGTRSQIGCDCAVATSGVAGPGGGTPEKPVGTVWIAASTPHATECRLLHLPGNRARVIDRAATEALLLLAELL